jgi:Kef-type K+ transport system membrane component KefB
MRTMRRRGQGMLDAFGIHYEPNILVVIGLVITVTFLGGRLFQRWGIPQVVGYIVTGLILGGSFLSVVPPELAEQLNLVSDIALGLIGFDIGSHLRLSELHKLGRSIIFILLAEAFGAFFLVTAGVFALTQTWHTAIIFGALAAATDPAATVAVIAEHDAKGPLTTSLLAVVGMDDALALLIFSFAAIFSESLLLGTGPPSALQIVALPAFEIGGAIVLGLGLGALLHPLLKRVTRHSSAMVICIGFLLAGVGLSQALGISFILTSMILGMFVVNRSPKHGLHVRHTIDQAGPVIYVLFFAMVGARVDITLLPAMGLLGLAYVLLRSGGKFGGAWLGGVLGQAEPVVRKNLGLGLLSQAGVAIGLALTSYKRFCDCGPAGEELGALVVSVVTASTFVLQLIGPLGAKFAISRAGEVGQASWEDDELIPA